MTRTRLTERTTAGQRGYASGRVLGWLFRRSQEMADEKNYDLLNAVDLPKRAAWAIVSPQSELFQVEKRRLPAIAGHLTEAIKRGTSSTFFLACLAAMELEGVVLEEI